MNIKINKKYLVENIFTEYDDSLTKKLNIDPLGFQVVWTLFGQKIFNNKTTSVALDIRSYNINLFNHYVVYKLLGEDRFDEFLNSNTRKRREKIEKILITLENMLTWSWYENRDSEWSNEEKKGLLGTSKALVEWKDKDDFFINLNKDIKEIEVLKNQKSLGVNGRYKGPFVSIGFFDSNYSDAGYKNSQAKSLFEKVGSLIESEDSPFKSLYEEVCQFFEDNKYSLKTPIPESLTDLYTAVFRVSTTTAQYTKEFWMKNLGLDSNEAKAIYENIKPDNTFASSIFLGAVKEYPSSLFDDILRLEPQLTYIDLLFDYLLMQDGKAFDELENSYSDKLSEFEWGSFIGNATGFAKERLELLSEVKDIETLIKYHEKIMTKRGQGTWIEISKGKLKVSIIKNVDLDKLKLKLNNGLDNEWIHDYYIYSISNIKKGLES